MKVQASYGEYSVDGISKAAKRAEEQGYEIFSASETGHNPCLLYTSPSPRDRG